MGVRPSEQTDRVLGRGNNYDETEWVVANQIVHHSSQYPSHVILPIVRSGAVADANTQHQHWIRRAGAY